MNLRNTEVRQESFFNEARKLPIEGNQRGTTKHVITDGKRRILKCLGRRYVKTDNSEFELSSHDWTDEQNVYDQERYQEWIKNPEW